MELQNFFENKLNMWKNSFDERDYERIVSFLVRVHNNDISDRTILSLYGHNSQQFMNSILDVCGVNFWYSNCMTDKSEDARIIVMNDFGEGRHDYGDLFYFTSGKEVTKRDNSGTYKMSKFIILRISDMNFVKSDILENLLTNSIFVEV